MEKCKIAVVILNWNGVDMLRTFLPSVICSVKQMKEAVVYVADNGSTDDSVGVLRREFPEVRLILLEENLGFAEGYNSALRQVDAEYAVLLNSDVEVTPQWLMPLSVYMDAHPAVAACQPKILSYIQKERFEYAGAAGGYVDCYGYPFCRGRIFGKVENDEGQYDSVVPVFWATGAALFIRLHDYWEAGGLDGRFFAHMEEIDLCWRLRARGKGLACVPQSVVYHVGGGTLKKENPQKTFLNFRNNLLMLYKNLPEKELHSVMRVRALLDNVAALSFLLKLQWPNALAVWRARQAYRKLRVSFAESREYNLQQTTMTLIPERKSYSILVQYYLQRRKLFSSLPER